MDYRCFSRCGAERAIAEWRLDRAAKVGGRGFESLRPVQSFCVRPGHIGDDSYPRHGWHFGPYHPRDRRVGARRLRRSPPPPLAAMCARARLCCSGSTTRPPMASASARISRAGVKPTRPRAKPTSSASPATAEARPASACLRLHSTASCMSSICISSRSISSISASLDCGALKVQTLGPGVRGYSPAAFFFSASRRICKTRSTPGSRRGFAGNSGLG
jgi:hypothetical protein